ncbi:MAG TPA: hypothetical protein VFG19_00580 [Geobacteraceae bacterium]|nr:hypothetical protein [Geobacteraceae bacterium]
MLQPRVFYEWQKQFFSRNHLARYPQSNGKLEIFHETISIVKGKWDAGLYGFDLKRLNACNYFAISMPKQNICNMAYLQKQNK